MSEKHNHHHEGAISQGDELKALLEYMVKHNVSHTEELAALAEQLNADESREAYQDVLKAIEQYKNGNALLSSALALLK